MGKPHKSVFDRVHAKLNFHDKSRIIMIGDSILTDVLGNVLVNNS